jgi:hypothetical protein
VIAEEQIESSLSNIEMSKSEKSLQKPLALARLADQKEDNLKDKVKQLQSMGNQSKETASASRVTEQKAASKDEDSSESI